MSTKGPAEQRWEQGLPHHPISQKIGAALREIDTHDEAGLKFGGDGDNGETLLYLLDEWFDRNGGTCPCGCKPEFTNEEKQAFIRGMLDCEQGRQKLAISIHRGLCGGSEKT